MPGNTAHKRTKTSREIERQKTAELDHLGFSQVEIAKRLRVSQPQVSYDLKKIRAQYRESTKVEIAEKIGEKLSQYRNLRRDLHEAWQRSWQALIRTVELLARDGTLLGSIRTIKERLPDPRFMQLILNTYAAERALLGLDAPPKTPVNGQVGVSLDVNWEPPPRNPNPIALV
jgi:predicted transcriptional regulator